jgi:DNA-binding transcriptional MerR regulator
LEGYSIGEVCRLLGIKPHILRYWERELDFLKPLKDDGGRRKYSTDELQLLFRIQHLVQEQRLTLEGVKKAFWDGLDQSDADRLAEIRQLRRELLGIERLLALQRSRLEKLAPGPKNTDINK